MRLFCQPLEEIHAVEPGNALGDFIILRLKEMFESFIICWNKQGVRFLGTLLTKRTNRNMNGKWEERASMGWLGGQKKRGINIRDKLRGLICREAQGWMLRRHCIMWLSGVLKGVRLFVRKIPIFKELVRYIHCFIRQSPPSVAEAEKSDRIETDQRVWRVFSWNSKTVGHIDIRCRADTKAQWGCLSLYNLSTTSLTSTRWSVIILY